MTKGNKLVDQEDILQAVIVADSFDNTFKPLTLDTPRCLLPIANVPILEYSLETLAASKVQEIIIVCCSHADKIKTYYNTFPKVTVKVSKELLSMGDVLRELDNSLTSDFILMNGDTVANVDLTHALEEHKARREKDKNAIITMVVKQASQDHASRDKTQEALFVLDHSTSELLHYESTVNRKRSKSILNLSIFDKRSEVQVRNDLMDCHIDICSIEVPALFTENFDYQEMRKDFVRGILEHSDVLGKTMFCHVLKDRYAARVSHPGMYDAVSKDILGRWTYPLVPDSNYTSTQYEYSFPGIYKEPSVKLSSTCQLKGKVVLGRNTTIGKNSIVSHSVLGRDVVIGDDVIVEGAYIMDGCRVDQNARVYWCILSENVHVGSESVVPKGCLLGSGASVKVGPNITLESFSRWSTSGSDPTSTLLGEQGIGSLYTNDSDDESIKTLRWMDSETVERRHSVDEESGDEELTGVTSESEVDNEWQKEVQLTLERAFRENHAVDIAGLELNTLKVAFDITFQDVRSVVIPLVMQQINFTKPGSSTRDVFEKWAGLIQRFVHCQEDQREVLVVLSNHCLKEEIYSKYLSLMIQTLYDQDVLEEDVILKWHPGLPNSGPLSKLKESLGPFIKWLEEAEEESSEEDE